MGLIILCLKFSLFWTFSVYSSLVGPWRKIRQVLFEKRLYCFTSMFKMHIWLFWQEAALWYKMCFSQYSCVEVLYSGLACLIFCMKRGLIIKDNVISFCHLEHLLFCGRVNLGKIKQRLLEKRLNCYFMCPVYISRLYASSLCVV